ncbi:class I SAM-dependent methyltransferase [Sphingomicrobium flavum]|uniref:class I SAM-dependent methyltransferase n=1 Tax=Sphingomicrobium flavum TaxID=1229164 RepID=UPI0021ADC2F6|nr:SAM-dependent methyltransferase [Sphingomicrobium flavum]
MSFAEKLIDRIAADGGWPVDRYFEASNNHYYATRDPMGAQGDFTTAPEISQMFGELVGAALADCWHRAGSPADAIYVELGPGRGSLAADAMKVLRSVGFAGGVHLIETSPALRKLQAERLPGALFHDDLDGLPAKPILLVANEFFDALPVRQRIGEEERMVVAKKGRLTFAPEFGDIIEIAPARAAAAQKLAHHLGDHGGAALIIDYGYGAGETGDTLQAVKGHEQVDALAHPGEADLTAHVDFAALAAAALGEGLSVTRMISQGNWLETLGLGARAMTLAAKNPERSEEIAGQRRRLAEEMGQIFKVIGLHHPGWPAPAGLPEMPA